MAVAWPAVRAALASQLPPLLPAVSVYDGPVVSGDSPTSYLTIGYAPSATGDATGTFDQENGPDGYAVTETGGVLMELAAVTGDTSVPSVFDAFDVIASHVQADMTLGGALMPGSVVTCAATVVEAQTTSGATQRLVITINYRTNL